MTRAWLALVILASVACKEKAKDAPPPAKAIGSAAATAPADKARPAITGPSVTPIITSSITFFVPKDGSFWGEMAFGCYAGAITLQPGTRPSEAFTKISPLAEPALRAADIDLDKDVGAIGAWGCGNGGACVYAAVALRQPDKLKDLLAGLVPGAQPKEVGKHSWTIQSPGVNGMRNIGLRAVPINWPAKLPTDAWSTAAARATHVVFLTGLFDKTTEVDALAAAADPKVAVQRVIEAESLVTDPRGRCVLGHVAAREFQPGYSLDHARFMLAAPEGSGDPLTNLVGSHRSLDLEVELVLTPAPTDKQVTAWIAEARAWLGNIGNSVRAGFAGQGAMVDAIYEMAGLLGRSGFRHTRKDKALTLSFRTDRITSAEIRAIEARFEGVLTTHLGGTP